MIFFLKDVKGIVKKNYVLIYLHSYCSESIWLSFLSEMEKENIWRIFKPKNQKDDSLKMAP